MGDHSKVTQNSTRESDDSLGVVWKALFAHLDPSTFPQRATHREVGGLSFSPVFRICLKETVSVVSLQSVLQLSWALLVSQYTGSNDILFGALLDGFPQMFGTRQNGCSINSGQPKDDGLEIPLRIDIDIEKSIEVLVEDIHRYLHRVRMIGSNEKLRKELQSLYADEGFRYGNRLMISLDGFGSERGSPTAFVDYLKEALGDSCPLTVSCIRDAGNGILCCSYFDNGIMEERQIQMMMNQFVSIVQQVIAADPSSSLANIHLTSDQDLMTLKRWNSETPEKVSACLHDLVSLQADSNPETLAVVAWDGELSYRVLDELSSKLACHLSALGVGNGEIVALFFEKSVWVVVSMLAVLKTGAVCTAISASYPLPVFQEIIQQTKTKWILASGPKSSDLLKLRLLPNVLVVSEQNVSCWRAVDPEFQPIVEPSQHAFIIFTSGSTGKPKGIVFNHSSLATSMRYHSRSLNIHKHSRVLQFSAYAFDVSIYEIFTTLTQGGSVFVPSEAQRMNNLAEFIRFYNITWAWFTPSFLRTIDPHEVECLVTVVVGGEAVTQDIANTWADKIELINGYGPAECTICASGHIETENWKEGSFGRAVGCTSWITHTSSPEKLAAIGSIGELLIEGPVLAEGYLEDPLSTKKAFISSPAWTKWLDSSLQGKIFYRTGDLVQYNPDGTLRYIGRNDSQVKINGQRIDLGEVERAIKGFDSSFDVVVEAVIPKGGHQEQILTAFVSPNGKTSGDSIEFKHIPNTFQMLETSDDLAIRVDRIKTVLSETLPRFMVPTLFIPISGLPLTTTGKTDRRKLRGLANRLSRARLSVWNKNKKSKPPQMTKSEMFLHSTVERILGIDEEGIDMSKSFIYHGGDSLAAINLVGLTRRHQMALTVEEVLQCPSLSHLAMAMREEKSSSTQPSSPFAYFENESAQSRIRTVAREQCGIQNSDIENIYPCTPLQEGLMALTFKNPGMYRSGFVYRLPSEVSLVRLRSAWNAATDAYPILRTKIIQTKSGQMFQVVIRDMASWTEYSDFKVYTSEESQRAMELGKELVRLSVILCGDKNGSCSLVLSIHHSLYDGWSLPLILRKIEAAYKGERLEKSEFYPFIEHIHRQDQATSFAFWNSQLSDLNAATFPELPSAHYVPISTSSVKVSVEIPFQNTGEHTVSTKIRLAWVILLSLYTDSKDVLFGATVSGRAAPLLSIEEMVGPTIATVPIRTVLKSDITIDEALGMIQRQFASMIPFEQTGLQNIRRMGPDAAAACDFQNLLVIQPQIDEDPTFLFSHPESVSEAFGVFTLYALTMLCQLGPNSVTFEAIFDDNVIIEDQARRIIHQFGHVLQQIHEKPSQTIGQTEFLSKEDASQLETWNSKELERVDSCVHHLIQSQCELQPNRLAVCAWDGELNYAELERLSSLVAYQLRKLGVLPNVFVPVFFEKSKWAIVAILAVMKSGGAFLLLDINQPQQRQEDICREVGALVIISSNSNSRISRSLAPTILIIGDNDFPSNLNYTDQLKIIEPCPRDALYVIFTSGSTGKPKGVIIEHGSYASVAKAHSKPKRIGSTTRALQLSSYAFDACMVEILTVLINGGCVCVASESESRNDIPTAIKRLQVNWIAVTPSVLKLLSPEELLDLKTIIAVGESMSPDQIELWSQKVNLFCGYGPAECSAAVGAQPVVSKQSNPRNIGYGLGAKFWVVNPSNHNLLMPVGAIGELIIEGPVVGRGYINAAEKTNAAFLEETDWMHRFRNGPRERLYKTGDLVRYNIDGTCNYIGRRDRQIKLRGQRLELEEVECRLREAFEDSENLIAEVIRPKGTNSKPMLVAFVQWRNGHSVHSHIRPPFTNDTVSFILPSSHFSQKLLDVERKMRDILPIFMVPSVFLRLHEIPLTPTGKTNRRVLQIEAAALSKEELLRLGGVPHGSQDAVSLLPHETVAYFVNERVVELVVNESHAYTESLRGKNLTLSHLGLDSIDVMAIARSVCRNFDVNLSVSKFFKSSTTVRDIAKHVAQARSITGTSGDVRDIDLYGEFWDLNEELLNDSSRHNRSCRPLQPHSGHVFLTGGTGFLGTEILKQLLRRPETRRVVVLVRAKTAQHAMSKIITSASISGWWKETYRSLIDAWPGDLSKPRFGLGDLKWDALCGNNATCGDRFDSIIHNGAVVHWNTDYLSLKASNVTSTYQLLKLLSQSSFSMSLTYISGGLPNIEGRGDRELADMLSSADGYSQTKFVSELLIKAYGERDAAQKNKISIIRPGLIIGSAENGVSNADDFIWRIVSTALSFGGYNGHESDSWIMVSSVDTVANLVVTESFHSDFGLQTRLLTDGLTVDRFWEAVKCGSNCKLQPYDQQGWLDAIQSQIEAIGKAHPLWPVIHFVEATKGCIGMPVHAEYRAQAKSDIVEALVKSVQYIVSRGLFKSSGASPEVLRVKDESLFRRNRRV